MLPLCQKSELYLFKRNEQGFTFVETLLTLAIMAVLSAAIVGLLNTLIALEIRQEGKQICLYLAREGLEEVLHVRNQEGFDAITSNRFSQSETIEGYPQFSRQIVVEDVSVDLKKVTVTVTRVNDFSQTLSLLLGMY